MRREKGTQLWVLIGLLALLLFTLQGVGAQDQPVFNIGILDNERGPISNGARLAVREINDAGGIRGADGTIFKLSLVIQPSNFGANLDEAVNRLLDANVIAALGPETTDEVLGGLPTLQNLGVPVITPATGDTVIVSDTSGLLFRSRAAEAVSGLALANYIIGEFDLRDIATIQLDVESTASVLGFTSAAEALGVTPDPAIILDSPDNLASSAVDLIVANPAVIVAYGSPSLAAGLYSALRAGAWEGMFVYNRAFEPIFRATVPFEQLSGVVATMTWAFTSVDMPSVVFLNSFIRAYGTLPGEVEAASYDSVKLIADALTRPGTLQENLVNAPETEGVQGILSAADLGPGELSNNVAIVRLGALGAPEVLAHYMGAQRVTTTPPLQPNPTATPAPTDTPEGVTLTIRQTRQNVRTGPGDNYPIIGQMIQGEQATIIGANSDRTWVVINFRGVQGWLVAYLLDISGDLGSVPVVPTPPTPTPGVTATPAIPPTPTPAPNADVIIDSVVAVPTPIAPNQTFTINVTVRNIGGTSAGTFAVAGTFAPNNLYLIGQVPSLGPGQSAVLPLSGVLSGSGTFTTSLVIDANNQVPEGIVGEQNNIYNFTYTVGQSILNQGMATLNLGDTIDLEGNAVQGDANWNADGGTLGLKAIFGAKLGVLGSGDYNAVTWEQINPSVVNRDSIPRTEINPGTLIGIITADGHRGVMQVNTVSDTQIVLTYKVYNG